MGSHTEVLDTLLTGVTVTNKFQLRSLTLNALSAEQTIDATWPPVLRLDCGGSARTILLPAEASCVDRVFLIINTGGEIITVEEDSSTTAIGTIGVGESALFHCDGTAWLKVVLVADAA